MVNSVTSQRSSGLCVHAKVAPWVACSWAEVGTDPANVTPPITGSESFGWWKRIVRVCGSLVCAFPFTFLNVGPWVMRGQAPAPREGVGDAASGVPRCGLGLCLYTKTASAGISCPEPLLTPQLRGSGPAVTARAARQRRGFGCNPRSALPPRCCADSAVCKAVRCPGQRAEGMQKPNQTFDFPGVSDLVPGARHSRRGAESLCWGVRAEDISERSQSTWLRVFCPDERCFN